VPNEELKDILATLKEIRDLLRSYPLVKPPTVCNGTSTVPVFTSQVGFQIHGLCGVCGKSVLCWSGPLGYALSTHPYETAVTWGAATTSNAAPEPK
jgi:hypothetical protein